jgi:DNA-binding response OmpR family regulator
VIVLTARDPQSNEQKSLQAGATAFFQKPADNNELLEVIRTALPNAWPGTAYSAAAPEPRSHPLRAGRGRG